MRRDAVFGQLVHFLSAYLYLHRVAVLGNDGGVDGLVQVVLGVGNVVVELAGHRTPVSVNDSKSGVAVLYAVHQHAQREQVVYVVQGLVLRYVPGNLVVNRVDVLGPTSDIRADLRLVHLFLKNIPGVQNICLALRALGVEPAGYVFVFLRVDLLERQVLQLPLHIPDSESVGERGVYVQGLLRLLEALGGRQVLYGFHVVQAVGELYENDPYIAGHCHHHLANRLSLGMTGQSVGVSAGRHNLSLGELGYPVNQARYILSELVAYVLDEDVVAVLHHVVQERG